MTITITANQTHTADIPQSWNDLTPTQAMTVLELFQLPHATLTEKRISILSYLLGWEDSVWQAWEDDRKEEYGDDWKSIHAAELSEMLLTIGWLLEQQLDKAGQFTGNWQLSPKLTKNPIPKIILPPGHVQTHGRASLLPPTDELQNLTGEELAHTFDAYEAYTQNPTDQTADRLIAILYRPAKAATEELEQENYYGDRRRPLNLHNIDDRSNQISKVLTRMTRNIILFWFLSCRMQIVNTWPIIFQKADEHRKEDNKFGWWGIYRSITGDVLKVDDLAKKPYTDLFVELAYLETQRIQREMDAALKS